MDQSLPPEIPPGRAASRWLALAEQIAVCTRQVQRLTAIPAGLRLPEALLLWLCGRADPEGTAQAELARRLAVSPAQVSHLLERLRGLGWLQAHRPAADRRCQRWRLTPLGRQVLAEIERHLEPWVAELEKRSGEPLVDRVTAALGELTRTLEAHAEAGNDRPDESTGSQRGLELGRRPLERGAA